MIINDYKRGGLQMIDIESFCMYMILYSGLRNYIEKWFIASFSTLHDLRIWPYQNCQFYFQTIVKEVRNDFWKDVLSNNNSLKLPEIQIIKELSSLPIINFIQLRDIDHVYKRHFYKYCALENICKSKNRL